MQIQIEENFLQFLDDPSLIEPQDLIDNLVSLTANDKFITDVIKREIR